MFGAGASKYSGGLLLGSIPIVIETELLQDGVKEGEISNWLKFFYHVLLAENPSNKELPITDKEILERKDKIGNAKPLEVNLERALTRLYRLNTSINDNGKLNIAFDGNLPIDVTRDDINTCIEKIKSSLASHCRIPTKDLQIEDPEFHVDFLKKFLTRPLNLRRITLFTLNYDTLIEQAADAAGIVLIDGFMGIIHRVFRPEVYDQDLYFPAETTEGRVHRLDKVLHLYKLHGSITWIQEEPDWNNPYGVSSLPHSDINSSLSLIYPTPSKYGETLGLPYSEIFRRFAASIVRPQSTLFVIGYGFGDEHVNSIIRQALTIPSFTMVVIDPFLPKSDDNFVNQLRKQEDRRVWLFSGMMLGSFEGFVMKILPDLRDQEILQKVMTTYRSLGVTKPIEANKDKDNED